MVTRTFRVNSKASQLLAQTRCSWSASPVQPALLAARLPRELSVLSATTEGKNNCYNDKRRGQVASPFVCVRNAVRAGSSLRFPSPKLDRKRHLRVTPSHRCSPTLTIMRGAFVVQLGPESKPAEGRFEGWVQEVDSCRELRFRSSEELLKFLGQRFDVVMASASKARVGNRSKQGPLSKENSRKERSSS